MKRWRDLSPGYRRRLEAKGQTGRQHEAERRRSPATRRALDAMGFGRDKRLTTPGVELRGEVQTVKAERNVLRRLGGKRRLDTTTVKANVRTMTAEQRSIALRSSKGQLADLARPGSEHEITRPDGSLYNPFWYH